MKKTIKRIFSKKKSKDIFGDFLENEGINSLYKSMVEKNVIMIYAVDVNGIVRLSEGKELKLIGVKPGQLVGQNILELYKDFPEVVKSFKLAFKGENVNYVTTVGGVSFVTTLSPIKNKNGKIVGAQGTSINISEQLKLEEELKDSEQNYSSIFEYASDAMLIHEVEDGIITDANTKAIKLFGYSKEQLIGKSVLKLSSGKAPYDAKGIKDKIKLTLDSKYSVLNGRVKIKKVIYFVLKLVWLKYQSQALIKLLLQFVKLLKENHLKKN